MCGIVGFIDVQPNYDSLTIAKAMGDAIYHRGPDDYGIWQDDNYGINLTHRRLAILDLSHAGHQPMASATGRYIIVFNGEVYNYKAIYNEITSKFGIITLQGHSDTEVVMLAIEFFGFVEAVKKFEGMFAIAIWDRQDKQLLLARDKVGEKPLYYGFFNGVFGFTSELKALKNHPKFNANINQDAISQFILHSSIPGSQSIYNGIFKLEAASCLVMSFDDYLQGAIGSRFKYWDILENSNSILEIDYHRG